MESPPPVFNQQQTQLLTSIRQHVATLALAHQHAHRLLYSDQLSLRLEELVQQFGEKAAIATAEKLETQIVALLYPLSRLLQPKQPNAALATLLQPIQDEQLLQDCRESLEQIISQHPQRHTAKLVLDALVCIQINEPEHPWADLRQLENEINSGKPDRLQHMQLRLQELLSIRYYTSVGKQYWQARIGQEILAQKKRLEKQERSVSTPATVETIPAYSLLEIDTPVRAAQTFFRAVYRNHINLSAIADNKANIMISVNSILISVLITFLSYRNIAETQPMVLLPVLIFLVVGLASLVFAVLSARPKVTNANSTVSDILSQRKNVAFFGNFVSLHLEQFEEAMDAVLNDSHLLYGNMVRDLYFLGKVLDKKYRYLTISYNIFMVGLIVTVALFLFTFLYP